MRPTSHTLFIGHVVVWGGSTHTTDPSHQWRPGRLTSRRTNRSRRLCGAISLRSRSASPAAWCSSAGTTATGTAASLQLALRLLRDAGRAARAQPPREPPRQPLACRAPRVRSRRGGGGWCDARRNRSPRFRSAICTRQMEGRLARRRRSPAARRSRRCCGACRHAGRRTGAAAAARTYRSERAR